MLICRDCLLIRYAIFAMLVSYGRCEVCKEFRGCAEIRCSELPERRCEWSDSEIKVAHFVASVFQTLPGFRDRYSDDPPDVLGYIRTVATDDRGQEHDDVVRVVLDPELTRSVERAIVGGDGG